MDILEALRTAIGDGIEPKHLGILQVCLRGVIVFSVGLVMVRLGHKRFMARLSAFDAVLGFVLASALARAINGSAPLLPTLVMGFVLVFLHRALSAMSFWSEWFGALVKGQPDVLVENGKVREIALNRHKISTSDVLESARLHAKTDTVAQIKTATVERNGNISIIPKED